MASDDILIKVRAEVDAAIKNLDKVQARIGKMKNPSDASFKQLDQAFSRVEKAQARLAKTSGQTSRGFQAWALSIMFFGMALQRIFDGIWKSGMATFNDIAHTVMFTFTQFDQLNGSITYLQFVAGQALEPIAGFLIPIVDAISDWISNNEELFAGIVSVGAIAGTTFAAGGAAVLAVNGFIDLFTKLGVVAKDAGGSITGIDMGAFGAFLSDPIVIAVVAALAVLAGLSWKAFKETPMAFKAVKDVMGSLWDSLKGLGQSFLDLLGDIFDVKINWQDLAWFIAWGLALWADGVKFVVNVLIGLVDVLRTVIDAARLVGETIQAAFDAWRNGGKFDDASIMRSLSNLNNAWNGVKTATQNALNSGQSFWDTMNEGPFQFRADYEKKQLGVSTRDLTKQENVYIDKIEIMQQQGMNAADIIKELGFGISAAK